MQDSVNNSRRPLFAFTLIELLVVISIIALLIAILLPALTAARKATRSSQCLALKKQYALANEVHANDQLGYYVHRWGNGGNYTFTGNHEWFASPNFQKLILNKTGVSGYGQPAPAETWPGGLLCPDATFAQTQTLAAGWQSQILVRAMGYNWYDNVTDNAPGLFQQKVDSPSKTIEFGDALSWWMSNGSPFLMASGYVENDDVTLATVSAFKVAYRHPSLSSNWSFFDGHAESLKEEELSTPDNDLWLLER